MSDQERPDRDPGARAESLREALEGDPVQPAALLELAGILEGQGRLATARGLLQRALRAAPADGPEASDIAGRLTQLEQATLPGPVLSVILAAEEAGSWLRGVVAGLAEQDAPADACEVILMDQGVGEALDALLDGISRPDALRILRHETEHRGEALNLAAFAARGELLLFLDDDAVPAVSCLRHHIETHTGTWRRIAVLGSFPPTRASRRLQGAGEVLHIAAREPWSVMAPETIHDWTHLWTCNLSLPRRELADVGGFDEALHDPVLIDLELGHRLMGNGVGTLYEPEARCTFESRPRSLRFLRHTLTAETDRRHLLARHGPGLVRDGEQELVCDRRELDDLARAVELWEQRPAHAQPWREQALLLNLEDALRNVGWPARRIELPHLVRRTTSVLRQIIEDDEAHARPRARSRSGERRAGV